MVVTDMDGHNTEQTIQMLEGRDEYIVLSTGEIKKVNHTDSRSDNLDSLRKTFAKLRLLINANTEDPTHVRFITLTYAENMMDHVRLYKDGEKFIKRLRYYCEKNDLGCFEYIAVAEPQQRGAWHLHMLLIFDRKAPFISNEILYEKWGHGFTHIRAIDNVDNVGAYLTAYLADVELTDDNEIELPKDQFLPIVEHNVDGDCKKYVKGARLHLYPTGMKLYRCSRGIKRPVTLTMSYQLAMERLQDCVLTYNKSFVVHRDDIEILCNIRFYNKRREQLK